MPYLKLSLSIKASQFSDLEDLLSQAGALAITMEDAADAPILEPGVAETPLWPQITISALFPENTNQKKLLNKLKWTLEADCFANIQLALQQDEAWELKWLDYFQPITVHTRLWVGTQQHQPEHTFDAMVYLEPGLAFGTGSHPTTHLCLQWLAAHELKDKVLIDYGSGSGILGIAAAKLGAKKVICVDNDPQALTASLENAKLNGITRSQLEAYLPEELPHISADIIVANILATPLIELAPKFLTILTAQGALVLSGILSHQGIEVQDAYRAQISWQERQELDNWLCLYGIKANNRV